MRFALIIMTLMLPALGLSAVAAEHLRHSFRVAQSSRAKGSHPFGAVLVYKGRPFLTGENQVGIQNNPLKHAEIVLLERYLEYRDASQEKRLAMAPGFEGELPPIQSCQMYTSTQPCQMCEGAIHTMKVGKALEGEAQVFFGLSKEGLSEVVRGSRSHSRAVQVGGPHLEEEAKTVHQGFWR